MKTAEAIIDAMRVEAAIDPSLKAGDSARSEFDAYVARMPEQERAFAIYVLGEMGLPTSQEFLKAYTLGIIRASIGK